MIAKIKAIMGEPTFAQPSRANGWNNGNEDAWPCCGEFKSSDKTESNNGYQGQALAKSQSGIGDYTSRTFIPSEATGVWKTRNGWINAESSICCNDCVDDQPCERYDHPSSIATLAWPAFYNIYIGFRGKSGEKDNQKLKLASPQGGASQSPPWRNYWHLIYAYYNWCLSDPEPCRPACTILFLRLKGRCKPPNQMTGPQII